jgi:hypothetical protein
LIEACPYGVGQDVSVDHDLTAPSQVSRLPSPRRALLRLLQSCSPILQGIRVLSLRFALPQRPHAFSPDATPQQKHSRGREPDFAPHCRVPQ